MEGAAAEEIARYLGHWWNGELGLHYAPFGYSMGQVNKLCQLAQYCTGLLTVFELIRINDVAGHLRLLTTGPTYVLRFITVILNSPNLLLRLVTGLYISARGRAELDDTVRAALLEHVWTAKTEAEMAAERMDRKLQRTPAQRFFGWLEKHPMFSERRIRIVTFLSFALLTLAEILTAPT